MKCVLPRSLYLAVSLLVITAAVAYVAGSGAGGGASSPAAIHTQVGVLKVQLTDAQTPGVQSLVLAVSKVYAMPAGPDFPQKVKAYNRPQSVDVMQYAYKQFTLGNAAVTAGTYAQIRLVLAPNVAGQDPINYLVFANNPGVKVPLTLPRGIESALKIKGPFTVTEGTTNIVPLEVDPTRAVVTSGNHYALKPTALRMVLTTQPQPTYGALNFTLEPPANRPSAVVRVVNPGTNAVVATGPVNVQDGTFRAGLPPGAYAIQVTAKGFAPFDSERLTPPQSWHVATGADTPAGTVTLTVTP